MRTQWSLVKKDSIVQGIVYSERWKVPVEILPVHQRFVKILDKKNELLSMTEQMERYPQSMKKRLIDRIDNLEWDWNISRNRKFGIPIPIWFDKQTGDTILPPDEQIDQWAIDPVTDKPWWFGSSQYRPEELVLDTWFTSWLSPTINQTFINEKGYNHTIKPFDLRPQWHDIIRTRLFYTLVHSLYDNKQLPFNTIMINWHVLAGKNEKISKSKENAMYWPEEMLEKFWADVTRYRALSWQLGKDMIFEEKTLEAWQKLLQKLRNAFSFVKMHTDNFASDEILEFNQLYPTDQRLSLKLQDVVYKMTDYLDRYEYWLAKITLEDFFWHDFCDTYLEYCKTRLYVPYKLENWQHIKQSAQSTLFSIFYHILQLFASYMPHIVEEIYHKHYKNTFWTASIHLTQFPRISHYSHFVDGHNIVDYFERVKYIVKDIRWYKTANKMSISTPVETLIVHWNHFDYKAIDLFYQDILSVTKAWTLQRQEWQYSIEIINSVQDQQTKISTSTDKYDTIFYTPQNKTIENISFHTRPSTTQVKWLVINNQWEIACIQNSADWAFDLPGWCVGDDEFEQQGFARTMKENLWLKTKLLFKLSTTLSVDQSQHCTYATSTFVARIKNHIWDIASKDNTYTIHRLSLDNLIARIKWYDTNVITSTYRNLSTQLILWITHQFYNEIGNTSNDIIEKSS